MNPNKLKQVKLSVILDKLTELGWDYTAVECLGLVCKSMMRLCNT